MPNATTQRHATLLAGALSALMLALAPPAFAETLGDALAGAYRTSNLLEQNRALLRASDEDLAGAVAALRPVVNFSASTALAQQRSGGDVTSETLSATLELGASLTLYDGGAREKGVEIAGALVQATRASLLTVEQAVLLSAVQAFVDVRLASDTVSLRQNNTRVIERELQAVRDRFQLGEVTRTDVSIAEARLAAARSNLAAAEGSLAVARESYRLAVGRYPGALTPPPPLVQPARTLDAGRQIARQSQPALIEARHRVQVAELVVEQVAAQAGPRLGLSGGLSLSDRNQRIGGAGDSASAGASVALSLNQTLYQGGAIPARLRQAMARRDAARAGLHRATATVERDVAQAWAQLDVARASIEASERQIAATRAAFEAVREEASFGARTTLDLLNAEQEALDAQAALLRAQASEQNAGYGLLAAMGLLTAEQLKLGVPIYDVNAYHDAVKTAPRSIQSEQLDRILGRAPQ
jgi:outer membrane protein